mgnify:CR=1 FL=1
MCAAFGPEATEELDYALNVTKEEYDDDPQFCLGLWESLVEQVPHAEHCDMCLIRMAGTAGHK